MDLPWPPFDSALKARQQVGETIEGNVEAPQPIVNCTYVRHVDRPTRIRQSACAMTPAGPCQPPDEIDDFVRIRTIGLNSSGP
jgi:hypothetical protein